MPLYIEMWIIVLEKMIKDKADVKTHEKKRANHYDLHVLI